MLAGLTVMTPGEGDELGCCDGAIGEGVADGGAAGAGVACTAKSAAASTWAKITPVAFETRGRQSSFRTRRAEPQLPGRI